MTSLAEAPDTGTLATDEEKIVSWRQEELERAGYNSIHAKRIAERWTGDDLIDLHEAVELIKPKDEGGKGAPPHLAADILL